jgi:molecular chaperone DnaK
LQGERPVASGNRSLGNFQLIGLPPAPRGLPQIEVTFDIDANGILNVSAKDKATGKEQKITITASTGLSKDEAERMKKEADSHADEDKKRVAEAEARNRADQLVYQTEKLVKENRDKLSESDAKAVETAIEETRRAIADGNVDRMNQAVEQLTKASHQVAEVLYKSQQSAPGTGGAGSPGGGAGPGGSAGGGASSNGASSGQGDVVDAEFVDVDESKRPN